jgi:hypothetical protein
MKQLLFVALLVWLVGCAPAATDRPPAEPSPATASPEPATEAPASTPESSAAPRSPVVPMTKPAEGGVLRQGQVWTLFVKDPTLANASFKIVVRKSPFQALKGSGTQGAIIAQDKRHIVLAYSPSTQQLNATVYLEPARGYVTSRALFCSTLRNGGLWSGFTFVGTREAYPEAIRQQKYTGRCSLKLEP